MCLFSMRQRGWIHNGFDIYFLMSNNYGRAQVVFCYQQGCYKEWKYKMKCVGGGGNTVVRRCQTTEHAE